MLTLNDGRSELWQWDTGRTLAVDADCSQVHFSNKVFGRSIDVDVIDGVAAIPDILLQTDKELTAWAFVGTAENGYTKISKVFKVNKRNKPADYVFTPTDQTTLGEILGRIEDLENRPDADISKEDIQDAVNEYLDNNPVSVNEKDPTVPDWAKQPQKPTYTAAEVGALPDTTKIPSTAEDVGALPANAFIPKSATDVGAIPVPETATVGQTIVVNAVDENGKPTEWEAVDLPNGGAGGQVGALSLLLDWTAEETVVTPILTFDTVNETVRILIETPIDGKFTYNCISPNNVLIDAANGDLSPDRMFMHTLQKITDNDEWLYSVTGVHLKNYGATNSPKVFPLLRKITGGIKNITLYGKMDAGVNVKIYGR